MNTYNVIGIMSGTSLDGLDICYTTFQFKPKNNTWSYHIIAADTIELGENLKNKLKTSTESSALDLAFLNNDLGDFIGSSINEFIGKHNINISEINFIASHGHTIFHQPEKQLTVQIGNGANISALTKLPVICDFRTSDVALKGQGAPLVPIGDQHLFAEYDYCINLGGIANISFKEENNRIAYDICPVNIVLNKLAEILGKGYDENGDFARSGNFNAELLDKLNNASFYKLKTAKSLGIESITKDFFPLIDSASISEQDKLNTFVEHIALQISNCIKQTGKTILFTGGGTFNQFLLERIAANTQNEIITPSKQLIEFKEALIFGFLGVLRWKQEANCLKSVTAAKHNNIGGCIYQSF